MGYGIWKRKRYEKQFWIKKKKKKSTMIVFWVGGGTCILNSSKRVQWFCPATHKNINQQINYYFIIIIKIKKYIIILYFLIC